MHIHDLGAYPSFSNILTPQHFYQNDILLQYSKKDPHPKLMPDLIIEGDTNAMVPFMSTLELLITRPYKYKLGLGLPMCKVYADYWNGDLSMNSLEAYGSDKSGPTAGSLQVNSKNYSPGSESFQTNFRAAAKKAALPKIVFKPPKTSRASITSIINVDDNGEAAAPLATEKKRRAPKADSANKKAKTEGPKKPTKAQLKAAEQEAAELKKATAKAKSPETTTNVIEKPAIYATITAEKRKRALEPPSVADPMILEGDGNLRMKGNDEEDVKQDTTLPVVVLDIPLLDPKDPKPGQAEVVVHVMKMAEEKYGWNSMHPNSKSAIDLMDELLDDEDDVEDDEDDEVVTVDEKGVPIKRKDEKKKENKKKETKVNRKVGKYDCDDPFIDDTELQWEEEIATTKEGFFVYWGPLVDERSTGSTRKSNTKSKK
ncbi:HPC2-domain-containing protein [Metschnikowia bicuspidata]|uniref:HPC2-domain-containing protein n=1 Tax=Metschnikowia bicuspidata TaxID=27322 RepID=A0A4P9ZDN4_9ASCO|nr:HPC2-domain-containing protein [Metschnikowia bicuspidata]